VHNTNCGTPPIDWGQQGKHIEGFKNFDPMRSTLTADPEELAEYAGTGTPANSAAAGTPGYKERVDFGFTIGTYRDLLGNEYQTTKGMIVYSKRGIHIYPVRP